MKKINISEDEALRELKNYIEKNGVPNYKKLEKNHKEMGLHSPSYYIAHFGSWGKALEKIGYKSLFQVSELNKFSDEELIEKLKTWNMDYIHKNLGFLRRRFKKNMYGILKLVGREKEVKNKFLTKQDYIDIMKDIKGTITQNEFEKEFASVSTNFKKYFGTWNNFLKECGFEINREYDIVNKTNEEIIEEYAEMSNILGYENGIPSLYIKKELGYSKTFISYRFGSISKLKELAGFKVKKAKPSLWDKETILKKLSKKRMTTEEIRKDKTLPSPTTIFRIFKTTSINKVYEEVEEYKKNNRG